jgi:hypothetical protein
MFGNRLTAVVLRFSRLKPAAIPPSAFAGRLRACLSGLPAGVPLAIELGEADYMTLDYARVLAERGAAHVIAPMAGGSLTWQASQTASGLTLMRAPASAAAEVGELLRRGPELPTYVLMSEPQAPAAVMSLARALA